MLTFPNISAADAAEAAKVARHESSIQRGEVSSERRGRDDRNQDMRPGEFAHLAIVTFFSRCSCVSTPLSSATLSMPCVAGDWMCPSCNVVNFANRTECFRCSEARCVPA